MQPAFLHTFVLAHTHARAHTPTQTFKKEAHEHAHMPSDAIRHASVRDDPSDAMFYD